MNELFAYGTRLAPMLNGNNNTHTHTRKKMSRINGDVANFGYVLPSPIRHTCRVCGEYPMEFLCLSRTRLFMLSVYSTELWVNEFLLSLETKWYTNTRSSSDTHPPTSHHPPWHGYILHIFFVCTSYEYTIIRMIWQLPKLLYISFCISCEKRYFQLEAHEYNTHWNTRTMIQCWYWMWGDWCCGQAKTNSQLIKCNLFRVKIIIHFVSCVRYRSHVFLSFRRWWLWRFWFL